MVSSEDNSNVAVAGSAVILGATSALGQAVARELAQDGQPLVLAARNSEKLARVAADLSLRAGKSASIQTRIVDLADIDTHPGLIDTVSAADSYWLFYGNLPNQSDCIADWEKTGEALRVNFTSAVSLLSRVANVLEERKGGSLVVVSSVAGDRGRQSNYIYGTAKGALSIFCQGLRNRLQAHGVHVLTIKPGFIDTPMTADLPKTPNVLWATPERVAGDIVRAHKRGKDEIYTPWFWYYILLIIRLIPERIFKRLSL